MRCLPVGKMQLTIIKSARPVGFLAHRKTSQEKRGLHGLRWRSKACSCLSPLMGGTLDNRVRPVHARLSWPLVAPPA
jgi:hypothetical protein